MQKHFRIALVVLGSVMVVSRAADAQKADCLANDVMSANIVDFPKTLVTPQTAAESKLRDGLGLAGVTVAQVVRVSENKTCAKAAKAMNKLADTKKLTYDIYVVAVGDSYAVMDTTWRSGEYVPVIIFEKNWKFRRILLSF